MTNVKSGRNPTDTESGGMARPTLSLIQPRPYLSRGSVDERGSMEDSTDGEEDGGKCSLWTPEGGKF